jgi:tripartite-type tricarboxylate transporter receptor subunit TctC
MKKKSWMLAAALLLVAGAIAPGAVAQTFPDKPVRLVTPYPPGGSHSLHAGIIVTVAEPYLGQPLISVIRAGGGGAVAAAELAAGPADGYMLLFGDPTINSLRPQIEKLAYAAEDFVAIGRINYSPAVFVAGANAPFDDLPGMVAWAKANPNKLIYSSDNVNGFTYVAFEMLKAATGTEMKGIVFGGGGPAVAQLLGGHTMAYAGDPSVVADHIASKRVKAICATDTVRYPTLKDVPTCREKGVDIVWHFWRGVLVKKGTPPDRVEKLRTAFADMSKDKGFTTLLGRIGSTLNFLPGKEFEELLTNERAALKALYTKIKQ